MTLRLAGVLALCLCTAGCDSGGTVNVTPAPQAPLGAPASSAGAGPQPVVSAGREVFFSLVALDASGGLQQAKGVAFLPARADSGAAFELKIPGIASLEDGARALYAPFAGGIVSAISSQDSPSAELRGLQLSALSSAAVSQAPTGVRSLAASASGAWIAWADLQGKLSLWTKDPGSFAAPALEGSAIGVRETPSGGLAVLVKNPDGTLETEFFSSGAQQSVGRAPSDRAAESADGLGLAWIAASGAGEQVVFQSGESYELPAGVRGAEISYVGSGGVIVVERSSAGDSALTRIDRASGSRELLAPLHLNPNDPDGVVGPAPSAGTVYFADRESETFVIEKVKPGSPAEVFARTDHSGLGYVCPRGEAL